MSEVVGNQLTEIYYSDFRRQPRFRVGASLGEQIGACPFQMLAFQMRCRSDVCAGS